MYRKNLVLLVVALMGLVVSSLACSTEHEDMAAVASGVQEEVDNLDEECQLNVLWQQVGEDNKMAFLHDIHDGCYEAGRQNDWDEAWENTTDVSYSDYEAENN